MSQPTDPHQPQDPSQPTDLNQPQDPQGGTPASPPYGQSASYGQGTPSQPAAEQPAWGSAPSPATGPQATTDQRPAGGGEAGFFRSMVDFSFSSFITVKFSSFLYIIAFVVAALMWLSNIVSGIMFGFMWGSMNSYFGEPSFSPVPLILAILFGWIPSVIALIAMRLGLEFAVATVRTAQNTGRIAESAQHA